MLKVSQNTMGFLALTFLLLHKLYQQPVLAHQIMPFFLVLGLAGVPAALFFSFLALLEFQQPHFFHFQPCWSSSSPIFFIFSLAGVPAASFFSFSALLEFQQPHFFHFQPCWSSSSPIFFIFNLAGVPAAPPFLHPSRSPPRKGAEGSAAPFVQRSAIISWAWRASGTSPGR